MEIIIITKTTSVIHRDLFVESTMITVQLVSQLCDFVFFLDSLVLNKEICCQNSIKFFVFSWFVILHFSFLVQSLYWESTTPASAKSRQKKRALFQTIQQIWSFIDEEKERKNFLEIQCHVVGNFFLFANSHYHQRNKI